MLANLCKADERQYKAIIRLSPKRAVLVAHVHAHVDEALHAWGERRAYS
jgi:hypothetical protein